MEISSHHVCQKHSKLENDVFAISTLMMANLTPILVITLISIWLLSVQVQPNVVMGFHTTRNLTADEENTVDQNAFGIISGCKLKQDRNITGETDCNSFIKYLIEQCDKFAQGLDYCFNQDMLEYISGVSLLESGKPTPAQIEIQEDKERHQQAFQESLEREAKEATDHQKFKTLRFQRI